MVFCNGARYKSQSQCSVRQQHVTAKFLHSFHSREITNLFAPELTTVALRLWISRNFGQCCEYFMYFNWFLYLFTRSAILTAAKTKIIFILVGNSNMHGHLYNRVLFNPQYQTQECNEHQPVPSGLVIYAGYQQCQQFHPNVCTSHNESPRSESPSGSSGSGSENVNKQWEATEVKILIFAYKDQENLNNSKSSKGKCLYGSRFLTFYWTLQNSWPWKFAWRLFDLHVWLLEPRYTKTQVWCTAENLPREMAFTVLCVTAPNVSSLNLVRCHLWTSDVNATCKQVVPF